MLKQSYDLLSHIRSAVFALNCELMRHECGPVSGYDHFQDYKVNRKRQSFSDCIHERQ